VTWTLDPAQREILDAADRFARRELYPLAARMDAEEWWPDGVMARLAAAGLLGITIPDELGGVGSSLFASGLVLQALARHNHAVALSWVAHENLCLNNIYRHATPEQARRLVPALCAGTRVGGLALTEPGAGSDALGAMRTTARRDGDSYVLNGQKLYITNGPIADVLLVYARTDPSRGVKGISAFVVERPAFRVAQKLTKMGFRGSPTAEIVFEDARVPAANLLGEENRGVGIVMSGLDLERAMVSPICLGIAERALELAIAHARQREQFGKPIASFQMVQAKLAEIYVRVETMRAFTYRVLAACNALDPADGGRGEIHALTAASVLYAAEAMNRVLDDAVQIHGGAGYIWDTEINRLFRATKLLEIGAGTSEIRKLIISEELLAR
jgi:isovaleryl-CoA dehydrogenase